MGQLNVLSCFSFNFYISITEKRGRTVLDILRKCVKDCKERVGILNLLLNILKPDHEIQNSSIRLDLTLDSEY